MNYTLRIVRSTSEFKQLREIWDILLQKSPADNYFLTWDWVWTWWQVFSQKEDTLAIGVLEHQNAVTGIVPCYIRVRQVSGLFRIRTLYFLGTQQSGAGEVCPNYTNFIYNKGDERLIIDSYLSEITRYNMCDELCFSRMDYNSPTFRILQDTSAKFHHLTLLDDVFDCPVIKLPATWNEYLNTRSSSMRYKIRREQRQLQKSPEVMFSQPTNETEAIQYFEELITLHQKRWESRNRRGSFSNQQFSAFHRKMIPLMFKNNNLSLTVLSQNKEVKAALYNIRYKNKIYFYQSGVLTDPVLPAYGYLIHSYCIENAIQNRLNEYDFLLKGSLDGYKSHFANSIRNMSNIKIYRGVFLKTIIRLKELLRLYYRILKKACLKTATNGKV